VNEEVLTQAHVGQNPEYVRDTYMASGSSMSGGEWTEGSILVKEIHEFDANQNPDYGDNGALMAMVKRGGDYNPDHSGWEWFILSNDGSEIVNRGGDLNNGGCNSCHAAATDDYVFTHPSSYMLDEADPVAWFAEGAMNWERVDSTYGTDPLLAGAHGDDSEYSREIYRWQPGAVAKDGLFPIGTVILKRVSTTDDQGNIVYPDPADGAYTAMVKSGMDSWDWYMMNPSTGMVNDSGDLQMCIGCHSEATGSEGTDMVFSHPGMGN
jgi:hypothetical protein